MDILPLHPQTERRSVDYAHIVVAAAGAVAMSIGVPSAAMAGTTELVSVVADGSRAAGGSQLELEQTSRRAVSGDGRYVVFVSSSSTFGPQDGNRFFDIYLRDRLLDTNERITAPGTVWVNGPSDAPTITPDGRYVAFQSEASTLVPDDTNHATDVFVRDRQTGVIERVSVGSNGEQGDFGSASPSISSDGRYVAFDSNATTFAANTSQLVRQVYVRDRLAGTTTLVSVNAAGLKGNETSYHASISGDGQRVAFESGASNLAPGDEFGFLNVFVRDRQAGTTAMVSSLPNGDSGNSASYSPAISLDGRFVAFFTEATDLAPGLSGTGDIAVRNLQTGAIERITIARNGGPSDAITTGGGPAISADGRYVAFNTDASNLIADDTNGLRDVFVRDRVANVTERVSVTASGAEAPAGALSAHVSISGDGRVVAFEPAISALVANDFNADSDVYVHVRTPGSGTLSIEPQSLTFVSIELGRTQSDKFFLKNTGASTVNLARIGIRGTDRTQFLPTNLCGHSIAPGVTCSYVVTFKPTSLGSKTARLRVELANGTVLWRNIQGTAVSP